MGYKNPKRASWFDTLALAPWPEAVLYPLVMFLFLILSNRFVAPIIFLCIGILFSIFVRREILKTAQPKLHKVILVIFCLLVYIFFSAVVLTLYIVSDEGEIPPLISNLLKFLEV